MKKRTIYIMGLVTLFVFPIPAFAALYFFSDFSISIFFDLDNIHFGNISLGILIGIIYAGLAAFIMLAPIFKTIPLRVDELVSSMNLTYLDALFLSVCAAVGEELLFRVGMQFYLGPIITSVVFVAIHGYLNPFDWRTSLYGLVVLPLSFILAYTYEYFGLWPAVAIHFAYDAALFIYFIYSDKKEKLLILEEIESDKTELDEGFDDDRNVLN